MSPDGPHSYQALKVPSSVTVALVLCTITGGVTFVTGIEGSDPLRAWQAYLVNFLFWTCLSFGAVFVVAVLNMTDARWGRPMKRLAEAFGSYLPFAFLSFWILYLGREELFPWVRNPVQGKEAWLNVPFFFARNGFGILLLSLLSLAMVYYSLKSDLRWRRAQTAAGVGTGPASVYGEWRKQRILSPVIGIVYGFVATLIGFDLVMALDPRWYSTLFGGYFFIGSFYSGIAAVYLLSLIVCKAEGFREHLIPPVFHDMGKLLLTFCLFTGYLFYAQFLVIWYGNVPAETRYVILRVKLTPWEPLAWTILFIIFLGPFFILLGRRVKLHRVPMLLLSGAIMAGMWLERFIVVAPSLWHRQGLPLGLTEVLITVGFLGVLGLCLTEFLKRVPAVPVSDPLYRQYLEAKPERLRP